MKTIYIVTTKMDFKTIKALEKLGYKIVIHLK